MSKIFKMVTLVAGVILCFGGMHATGAGTSTTAIHSADGAAEKHTTQQINSRMSKIEKKVREAAVKVSTQEGHGSGGLIQYHDLQLVITAQHVADGSLGANYLISTETEAQMGVLVYKDALHDIAIIYVPREFRYTKGIKWNPQESIAQVGDEITYSGYPSWHSLMSYRGRVAGYETHPEAGQQIMLHSYGWFGCSGSLVYDSKGHIVGILWGIDMQIGLPQEDMIWVAPIQNLNMKHALQALCGGLNQDRKACK